MKPNAFHVRDSAWLTPDEAANYLGISKRTLDNWRSNGRYSLKFYKPFGRVLYKGCELHAFLEKRCE